jgi:peptidoglycan hydrolase FlgJ
MNPTVAPPSIFDTSALAALKRGTRSNDPAALKMAAQQFEALFLQMVLKSMRDATPREGLFDSEQTRMYESLLDQQLAQVMSTKGGTGLAALIEKQLSRQNADPVFSEGGLPLKPDARSHGIDPAGKPLSVPVTGETSFPLAPAVGAPAATTPATTGSDATASPTTRDFVNKVWPHAAAASQATGVPTAFLVAQAALETGWGRSEPRAAAGQSSFNVFGIKAGRSWNGPTVDAVTTEYVDGVAQQRVERFRAYGSYAEAFSDYARLLVSTPRYAAVVGAADATSFARGLQRAGYATDPAYADKLTRIIGSQTLRTALAA